jgi:hypothetical protein
MPCKANCANFRPGSLDITILPEPLFFNISVYGTITRSVFNIVRLDVSPSGQDAKTFQQLLESKGLKTKVVPEKFIRMVAYREIGRQDILQASQIINECCQSI